MGELSKINEIIAETLEQLKEISSDLSGKELIEFYSEVQSAFNEAFSIKIAKQYIKTRVIV